MITENGLETLSELRSLSTDPQWDMLLAAVQAGNSRARLWQADSGYLLWDQANNVFYLAGKPPQGSGQRDLAVWIKDTLRPAALAERRARFSVRLMSQGWEDLLSPLFRDVAFVQHMKRFYRFTGDHAEPVEHKAGQDVRLEGIEAGFLAREDITGTPEILSEIEWMWPSLDHFCRGGFGVAAVKAGQVICWCTAEYLSPTLCGIGIETTAGFERLGVATVVTAEFVNRALQRGIRPHWECDASNTGSMRVAEKAGFSLLQETPAWIGRFV